MNLESSQARNNADATFKANTSASLAGQQQEVDSAKRIRDGAIAAAAGETLGLTRDQTLGLVAAKSQRLETEEETLKAVSRQNRRQKQREAFRSRQQKEREWSQKQKTLADEGFKISDPDTDFADPDTAAAFGQDQSEYYEYQPGDVQYLQQEIEKTKQSMAELELRDELDRRLSTKYGVTLKDERTRGEYNDLAADLDEMTPDYQEFAPQGAGTRDALNRLQGAVAEGRPGAAQAAGRLEDDLLPNRSAEAALAAELVARDAELVNPEMVEYRQNLADAEAQRYGRDLFTAGGSGVLADENIGRIDEIRSLGTTNEMAQVIRTAPNGDFADAIVIDGTYRDANTLAPLAIQGPQSPFATQASNTPNTGQTLNVPQGLNASSWLQANVPDYKPSTRTFGGFPQTDITLATTNLANKIREAGVAGVPAQIRTLGEFQRGIDAVGQVMAQSGEQPFRFNPGTGKNEPSEVFGAEELFTKLRMTGPERADVANALYQTEVALNSGINQNQKTEYTARTARALPDVNFNATEAMFNESGAAEVAMIPSGSNIRVGTTPAGKPIKQTIVGQLRQMADAGADPEVTIPYMGAAVDPATGGIETDAGPGALTRYVRGPVARADDPEAMILAQARRRAGRKPVDMGRVRETQQSARTVIDRAAAANARIQAERDLRRRFTPANLRQFGRYS